jgi:hypothetical protein
MTDAKVNRHPVRGALYGLLLGFSAWYFLQFEFASFSLDSLGGVITRAVIVIVAGILVGVIWAYLAPARKPKGVAPAAAPPAPAAAPAAPAPGATEAAEAPAEAPATDPATDDGPTLPDDDE